MSCENLQDKKVEGQNETGKQEIFPVSAFVAGQLHVVDSLQLPVVKYTTTNNSTDTALISTLEMITLAKEFTEPDITDPQLKKFYRESSFADQSVPSVTFTYSTPNPDLEIQRVDVIIQPDPVRNDKVSSIYIEKKTRSQDTLIDKKLYFKANRNFQIITQAQAGGQVSVSQLKVVWDNTN